MPRASKSDAEKAASGTLQPCRRSRSIVISDATLTETPPVGLTKDAREAWRLAIACAPKGMLTALDVTVLERWARNYALYRKIAKQLDPVYVDVIIKRWQEMTGLEAVRDDGKTYNSLI